MGKKGQTKGKKAKGHHRSNHKVPATASAIDPMVELSRLQSLTPLEYEVKRQAVAKKLGIRVTTLDDLLKQRKCAGSNDWSRVRYLAKT